MMYSCLDGFGELYSSSFQKSKKRKKVTPSKNVSHSEASDTPAKVCFLIYYLA